MSTKAVTTGLPVFQTLAHGERIERCVSVALVGYGRRGEELADALWRVPGARLVAVADIWPWRRELAAGRMRALRRPVRLYETAEELLAAEGGRVDAVIVATPDWQHANHVEACLAAGKHVSCEGELAAGAERAKGLVRLARERRLLLQGGHQRRSNPRYVHAFEKVCRAGGVLGRVTHAYAQWHCGRPSIRTVPPRLALSSEKLAHHGYDTMDRFLMWEWHSRFGMGAVAARLGQKLDVLRWFWRTDPCSVSAVAGYDILGRETPDSLMVLLTFRDQKGFVHRGYIQVLSSSSLAGEFELFGGSDRLSLVCSENQRTDVVISVGSTCCEDCTARYISRELHTAIEQKLLIRNRVPPINIDMRNRRMFDPPPLSGDGSPPEGNMIEACECHNDRLLLPVRLDKPALQPHVENFVAAVRGETALADPGEQAYANLVGLEGALRAARERRAVDFTPQDFLA